MIHRLTGIGRERAVAIAITAIFGLAAGCGDDRNTEPEDNGGEATEIEDFPLTDPGILKAGAPSNSALPPEGKADEILPAEFDVVDLQSPVKSQGRRGVCSIFSTVGLMESLYITEGTITDPDFSEQYLQWSVKFEVGAFPNTAGSNATNNLEAISRFGIPEESAWPYEPSQWSSSDDEACSGDDLPTRCYTNGEPSEDVRNARKYHLPRSRYISTRPRDIKSFMKRTDQGVIVGGDFYYQSWNHGGSKLPTNSEYKRKGYVLYPNDADIEDSRAEGRRAGHSILLVGWDDDLEVTRVDENGDPMLDDNGNEVVEKGFFIFKNSWGTSAFGTDNELPDGYGYISQRYVEEFLRARASDLPEVEPPVEICGDELDNDGNGDTDCDDAACAMEAACQVDADAASYTNDTPVAIPDNDTEGITSVIEVPDDRTIAALSVDLKVEHTFKGDINAILESPDETFAIVLEASGDSGENIDIAVPVEDFDGANAQGTWTLYVYDEAAVDTGELTSWTLNFTYVDEQM
jgi:hypothetical protein